MFAIFNKYILYAINIIELPILQQFIPVENDRKKKAREAIVAKKMEKAIGADEKYSLGMKVLGKSDDGKKRLRDYITGDGSSDESNDGALSAAYRKENKIPVDLSTEVSVSSSSSTTVSASSKRRKASPPKQSHIMSKEEIKKMYPNMCLDDEEDCLDIDSTYPEEKVRRLMIDLLNSSSVMR